MFIYSPFVYFVYAASLPVQLMIGISIYLTSGSPIIYRQKRIGRGNKEFTLYKFRTMVPNAEKLKFQYLAHNEAKGPIFKIHNDPRFTPVGKFLSHTGLDELPQLYNILRGDMSFIGPRPLPVQEAAKLKPWQKNRHDIKPGIISPWVLDGYHSKTFDEWMKSDIEYIKNKSILYDISLSIRTMILIIKLLLREILSGSSGKTRIANK